MKKQYTAGMQHPIDIDINLFDFVESRAERDPDGTVIEYKTTAHGRISARGNSLRLSSPSPRVLSRKACGKAMP